MLQCEIERNIKMLEIPESITLANQVNKTMTGKIITSAVAASSPHKFAWYSGDPADYSNHLPGNSIISANPQGGMIEIKLTHAFLVFSDGVNLRYHQTAESIPQKHQLLLTFDDNSALSASVQMYGGLLCWKEGETSANPYYLVSKSKPSPLTETFDEAYLRTILAGDEVQSLSMKAALATQQRIPGLGNGVLQDILWNAKLNPHRKVNTMNADEHQWLFTSLKQTLAEMTRLGGRDTEKDLFCNQGGYHTVMSANNNGKPCPNCDTPIIKEAYLGGSVYYCKQCQHP
jgi:formamidopyrimidine-DNA glycosylase